MNSHYNYLLHGFWQYSWFWPMADCYFHPWSLFVTPSAVGFLAYSLWQDCFLSTSAFAHSNLCVGKPRKCPSTFRLKHHSHDFTYRAPLFFLCNVEILVCACIMRYFRQYLELDYPLCNIRITFFFSHHDILWHVQYSVALQCTMYMYVVETSTTFQG